MPKYGLKSFFVDDRCIICRPEEDYLGWLLVALTTSTGHFLSLHKANVNEPVPVFRFLGFEFDCPKEIIRLPEKRKLKMKNVLQNVLYDEKGEVATIIDFDKLEKFRGMAVR